VKNWKTTLTGLAASLYSVLEPILTTGQPPSADQIKFAIAVALLGWMSADGGGGGTRNAA
jgi:hypothetical protein